MDVGVGVGVGVDETVVDGIMCGDGAIGGVDRSGWQAGG